MKVKQHQSLVEVCVRCIRFQAGRGTVGDQCRFQVGRLFQCQPEMQMANCRSWIRGYCAPQEGERLLRITSLMTKKTEEVERPSILGAVREYRPIRVFCLGMAPRTVQGERLL